MAVSLDKMLRDLSRAVELSDDERIERIRKAMVKHHPEAAESAEASYRLGLVALFRDQNLDEAVERFRFSAKLKEPNYSPLARMSLALVLHRQGKTQQAIFDLRKVAGMKPASIVQAQALGLMVIVHREAKNTKEAERARDEQLALLSRLCKSEDRDVQAHAHYLLGMEKKFDGIRDEAKEHLGAALRSGCLSEQDRVAVEGALAQL